MPAYIYYDTIKCKKLQKNLDVSGKVATFALAFEHKACLPDKGEMVEWSITTVLKTVVLRGTGGSNPSLSAINIGNQCFTKQTPDFTPKNVKSGIFILFNESSLR